MPLKRSLTLFLFISFLQSSHAQQTDTFHYYVDYYEKPAEGAEAIYHIRVYKEKPTDADWKMVVKFRDGRTVHSVGRVKDPVAMVKQGEFTNFDTKGNKSSAGRYDNGKKEGEWLYWSEGDKLSARYHFHEDIMVGSNKGWYENGNLQDSFELDKAGNGMGYGYYEDGKIRYEGNFAAGLKKGQWKYYYDLSNRPKSMEINFEKDSLISSKCFTKDGDPQRQGCYYEKEAFFPGGDKAWAKYLIAELSDKPTGKWVNGKNSIYIAVVSFVVGKDGTLHDVKVENPDIKKLDKIAESVIRNSPPWEPAILYNQPVNAYRRQPITFVAE